MIHHLECLDLEITDFENHHDLTSSCKTILSQTSKYAMRDGVEHLTSFIEASRKKAKLRELSNNISDRSEAWGTGILSGLLLGERSEVSGKSAIYYIIHDIQTQFQLNNTTLTAFLPPRSQLLVF